MGNRAAQDIDQPDSGFEVGDFEVAWSPMDKVGCICPRCRKRHFMSLHWIGRGTPRKFCPNCKDRETPYDGDEE